MVNFHPTDEMLVDYAAGGMQEPGALLVAAHLSLAPESRARVRELEAVGGALLESLDPREAGSPDSVERGLEAVLARLDEPGSPGPDAAHATGPEGATAGDLAEDMRSFPEPLRSYAREHGAKWRRIMPGVDYADLEAGSDGWQAYLLRVKAGKTMPQHTHSGEEWVMVLSGEMIDEAGTYRRGDVQVNDDNIDHSPRAGDEEPCVCLVVSSGPLRLTGPVGRLFNPLLTQ